MIAHIIRWSIENRALVLIITLLLCAWGVLSVKNTPLDAIPDLSDLQVIIKTTYPGQSPEVVEDQVTYPITTAMLAVPKTTAVRGYSFFGDSYVYVIFEEGTDIYWARSRVLEYMNQVASKLPDSARASLGPDATGVGWVYQYVLVDRTGTHDLSQLRSLQDWFLKYELQTVDGVSEVATVGGMVKQYQVVLDPDRLRAFSIPLSTVRKAVQRANQEVGGSVIEHAEAEYMIRAKGYLQSIEDLEQIPISTTERGTPIVLGDIAHIRIGPQMRRGISDFNGVGEAVGGIVVMRWGENALNTIDAVKEKIEQLRKGLPKGVEIIEVYDRSQLILDSVDNLRHKLVEEFIVVAVVCLIFLFHLRSALVAIVILPLGILTSFIVMEWQGINANIMSLGGIAIAVGAMVDAAIVMIENAHKYIEKNQLTDTNRWEIMRVAATDVGPALFFSLLIITLSFIPVLTLEAQEGKLFSPLAFTKTYAMAAAAGLSITLMPVLMGYFIRGHIASENKNPINLFLIALYKPVIKFVLKRPMLTIVLSILSVASIAIPYQRLGTEFMPDIDEGDLMYMPTTFTGVSVGKAGELLQVTDRLIKMIPEVDTVFGKVGRAETATDPAPLTMIETTIQFKPRDQWRPGMTTEKIIKQLDETVKLPGLTNAWVMPIKTRIDMISTGIKTPLGIKIAGPDLAKIQEIGEEIEKIVKQVPGTRSVFSERTAGGRY
ncbi:efflux RND transporter permease subunit, partial [Kaarinaea lacus]